MFETEVRTQLIARNNTTFAVELIVRHDEDPFDFTDHTVAMQWRRGTEVAVNASTAGTDPAITIDANLVTVTVPVEDLADLAPGRYQYDIIATAPDGYAWQLAIGAIDLRKGITEGDGNG